MGPKEEEAARAPTEVLVKPYDFFHPDKFSKDHLNGLQIIFDTFARLVGPTLSSLMRGQLQVRLTSVEQLSYSEYVAQLPNPTAISLISAEPLPERFVLEINLPVAYAMIDRLLGGKGETPQRTRAVTDIEQSLFRLVVSNLLPSFALAWNPVIATEPNLEEAMFNTAFIPSAVSGTVAALALLEIGFSGVTGTMSIAMPYTVLEPVMGRINAQKWLSDTRRSGQQEGLLPQEQLRRAVVPVTAILGTAAVSLAELTRLQPGQIIRLDSFPGQSLRVAVGGLERFSALPGVVDNRLAVQITQVLLEDGLHQVS